MAHWLCAGHQEKQESSAAASARVLNTGASVGWSLDVAAHLLDDVQGLLQVVRRIETTKRFVVFDPQKRGVSFFDPQPPPKKVSFK